MLPVRVRGTGAVDSAAAHRLAFRLVLCHSVARFLRGKYVTSSPVFLAWAAADSRETNHDYAG